MMPRLECFRGASNCGFINASRCIGAAASDSATGSTAFSEMKLTSMTTTSGRIGSRLPSKFADIGLLHRNDLGMAAQRGMQLLAPDVDGKHQAGAVGEQHFGEAAGRGADVETDVILDLDRILLQRARQLDAAARDKGMRGLRLQHGIGGNGLGRLRDRLVVGGDEARFDRGLRPRPAFEQAALDQQQIRALAGRGHAGLGRSAPTSISPPVTSSGMRAFSAGWQSEIPELSLAPRNKVQAQASFTVSALKSLPSASNTLATMPLASRPARAYIAFGESWSRNTSGSTIARIRRPPSSMPCSASVCITWEPKPPIDAFLDGEQDFVLARQLQHQVDVERLHEARIGNGGGQAMRGQFVGGLLAFAKTGAERQQRDLGALADDAAFADLQRDAKFRHLDAAAFAARIAHRARTIVDRDLGRDHVHQFGLIGGRHDDEIGQAAEIGVVERAGMGRAVGADEAGAVDREAHRQALDRHVVDDLVVAALQEGRIDRAERLVALGRKTGGERHRMLLGDADVEGAVGERLVEDVDAGARRHRRGDADDLVVLLRLP